MRLHARRVAVLGAGIIFLVATLNLVSQSRDRVFLRDVNKIQLEEIQFNDYDHHHQPEVVHEPEVVNQWPTTITKLSKQPDNNGNRIQQQVAIEHPMYDEPRGKPGDREQEVESIWPREHNEDSDRIIAQLKYMQKLGQDERTRKIKTIYVPSGLPSTVPSGREQFERDHCPVTECYLTSNSRHDRRADIRLLQSDVYFDPGYQKAPGQIWVLWLLESPLNTIQFRNAENLINWTATYRRDSTIVTPYEKYVPYSDLPEVSPVQPEDNIILRTNYARGKTKLAAWFVSNCIAGNRRYEFVQELKLYVSVDVFGACGTMECPRSRQTDCNDIINRDYKFYLSFENSNCEDYVTEKFFHNGLQNDVIPIVMGARRLDYEAIAPPHSFIHVEDFASVRDLADYMLRLNASDTLYNEYFAWKGTGRYINTQFWCRLCAMAHDVTSHMTWYSDVDKWWRRPDVCTKNRWDDANSLIDFF